MENKMPFLGKINCRDFWKIDYHLHVVETDNELTPIRLLNKQENAKVKRERVRLSEGGETA